MRPPLRPIALLAASLLLGTSEFAAAEDPPPPRAPSVESLAVTPAQRDARLGWWREARFGMFVHWGVYSYLEGSWRGQPNPGYAEHIQRAKKISMSDYRAEVVEKFNPTKFNADEWIRLAKDTGMGYFVVTAKHHDGFAMFDSKASPYNIVKATPYAHDPMPELRDACRKYGVKFGFYYSHAFDWGEENGPGNDWDYNNPGGDKLLHGAQWWLEDKDFLPKARRYVDEKAIPQVLELIRQYHPDILWFDTPHKLPPEEDLRILAAVRQADPNIVVNGRIVGGVLQGFNLTDYVSTADKPAEFPPQNGDWEGIPTTNESYGYNGNDLSHKPFGHFIGLLVKAAARGGNVLMNVGPRADGSIDTKDVAILQGIGQWWKVNGASVCGTTRTPLPVQVWGESTRQGNRLYLHIFHWPRDGKLTIGGLKTPIAKASLLADPAQPIAVQGATLTLPAAAPDPTDSVIAVDFASEPQADPVRLLVSNIERDTLRSLDATLQGGLKFGPGKERDAWVTNWKTLNDAVVWPVRVDEPTTYAVTATYDAPAPVQGSVVEGDAGKEQNRAQRGAAGTYTVAIGPQTFQQPVQTGTNITTPLGRVTLPPGQYEIRTTAKEITGEELFRLRSIELTPVTPLP